MNRQQLAEKAAEILHPFETTNLLTTLQNLTLKQMFTNPVVLLCIAFVFFYGVIKRSKIVLLTLFGMIGLIVILRFAMPVPGEVLTLKSLIPFVCGGLLIGGVVIYISLIKSE